MLKISGIGKRIQNACFIGIFSLFLAGCATVSQDHSRSGLSEAKRTEIDIAVIDTNRVFQEHPAFSEAMGKFQSQVQEMQKKIEEMDEESKGFAQQMMQQQMQYMGMELQEEAFEKMRMDVQRIAKEKGYDYVVDSNMLIVGGQDITEEVLASFPKPVKTEKEPVSEEDAVSCEELPSASEVSE